jgi:hypothetical protein
VRIIVHVQNTAAVAKVAGKMTGDTTENRSSTRLPPGRTLLSLPPMKHLRISALVLIALGALAGCRSVALDPTGETVAVYQFGEFRMVFNSTAPVVAEATKAALAEADLFLTKSVVNKFDAQLIARAQGDQRVKIWIEEINRQQTLIRIRYGDGGNLNKSRRLYEMIDAKVK